MDVAPPVEESSAQPPQPPPQAQGPVSGTPAPTEGDTATTAAPGQGCPRRGTDNGQSHHNVSEAPMAILKNARHEKFAQNLARGMSATEAYAKVGYKPSEAHASRLAGYGRGC